MNNFEIIVNDAINGGFIALETVEEKLANGEDIGFHTFNTWKKMGYAVKRGSKALFVSRIWDSKYYNKLKEFRANGGKEEDAPHMWKTPAYFFSKEQVEKLSEVNEKVKMAKGEVSEKQTRKVEKKSKAKNTRKVKATRKAEKPSARELYENMEVGKPIVVKYENKKTRKAEKQTRKTEKVATPKVATKTVAKKVNSQKGKYNQEYYIRVRGENPSDIAFEKVNGYELNSKVKGLFCHKVKGARGQTRFTVSDIKTGLSVKSDDKLKDLLAWVNSKDTVEAIKNARKGDGYKRDVKALQNAMANA